jgi:exopolysaccharide biosynthesis polyprenyl glycosylphosphotransferase
MYNSRVVVLFFGDLISFILGFFAFISLSFPIFEFSKQVTSHVPLLSFLVILWFLILYIFNFYDIQKSKPNLIFLRNFGIAGLIMLGVGFIFFYLSPITNISPKTNLLIFTGISLCIILIWRRFFYTITKSMVHTRCAIICATHEADQLHIEISHNPQLGFACVGIFTSLEDFFKANRSIDQLIIHAKSNHAPELLEQVFASHIDVIDLVEAYETIVYKIPVSIISHEWVIHSIKKRGDVLYQVFMQILGILVSIIILVLTLPVTIPVAGLIWLHDRGPIIYKNDRVGANGKVFYLYKFRSMIMNAEKNKAQWAATNDSRVTPIGKIIRKLHIDEIPQMWNILQGDLNLVGPRAERPEFVTELEQKIPYYFMRHTIKPGFTGWAQIKFRYARSVMDSQEKFEYDLYYIKNRNLFLDFGIIAKTAQIIFTH